MTDLEITRLCAEAIGSQTGYPWNPLQNDAQAMALIKKFNMQIDRVRMSDASCWSVSAIDQFDVRNKNLNHAICECVAKMRVAK